MGSWKQYIVSLIVCSLSCSIVSQIISDNKRKELLHLLSGTMLGLLILQPISNMNWADILSIPSVDRNAAEYYIAEGKKAATESLNRNIKDSCEAYILDKAKELGAEIEAQVSLNKDLAPVFVIIKGNASPNVQRELEYILTTDLEIPKENQKWIWNQESNSS